MGYEGGKRTVDGSIQGITHATYTAMGSRGFRTPWALTPEHFARSFIRPTSLHAPLAQLAEQLTLNQ